MHNKHLVRLFFTLTFLFLSSTAYLLLPDQPKIEITKPTPTNIVWTDVVTNTVITDNKATAAQIILPTKLVENNKNESTATTTLTIADEIIKTQEIKNSLNITIEIPNQQFLLQLPEKTTVYDAIQKLITDKKINVSMKEFKGMGYFVEEINGLKNDKQTGEYWFYYINGQPAKIGISGYTLKNNDLITWKFKKGI